MKIKTTILFLFFLNIVNAQQERILNWDFSSSVNGAVPYRESTAWNEFNFDKTILNTTDTEASNGRSLNCFINKPFLGKDNYGIGQYAGRAQSIIPCPKANASFTFSARAKMAAPLNGENPGEIAVLFYNENGVVTTLPLFQFSATTYQTQTQTFNVPSDAVWCTVWVRKTETVDFYIDWVSLQATVDDTLAQVSGFYASDIATTKVLLNWDEVTGASGYKIERKLQSENATKWRTIFKTLHGGTDTSFLDNRDTGLKLLEPNTAYNYRITALGDYGNATATTINVLTQSLTTSPENTTYYIDAENGDDLANGTTESTAWKTFMNIDRLTLTAGNQILLKKGNTFDEPLIIHGSGSDGNNIIIGSYGTASAKPIIDVQGKHNAALRMLDVSYCTVQDLELSNYHPYFREFYKYALEAGAWNSNSVTNLNFTNLFINKVSGAASRGGNGGFIDNGELSAGIRLATDVRSTDPLNKMIYNVAISNCDFYRVEQHGAHLGQITNITIENNTFLQAGYTSLLCKKLITGSIKNNLFEETGYYMTAEDNAAVGFYQCENIIFEQNTIDRTYNYASGQSLNMDGCDNWLVRKNLFKDSDSGCFILNHGAENNIFHHNISIGFNDQWFRNLGGVNTKIFNNVAYIKTTNTSDGGFFVRNTPAVGTNTPVVNTEVYNNVFYRENSTIADTTDLISEDATTTGSSFSHNLYFGNFTDTVIEDVNALFDNPLFENNSGAFTEVTDFKLTANSPLIDAGISVDFAEDFGGNPLVNVPDIGAWEYQNTANISEYYATLLKIYPNPSESLLFLVGVNKITDIMVFNQLGQKVSVEIGLENNEASLNVIGLKAGIYILQANFITGEQVTKLFVKK